ncbi:MAG: hypothetical protein GC129_06695 [Proteobacteria bacterium]|nr:hypothetical protein [Pseudomonadota bacterium]
MQETPYRYHGTQSSDDMPKWYSPLLWFLYLLIQGSSSVFAFFINRQARKERRREKREARETEAHDIESFPPR